MVDDYPLEPNFRSLVVAHLDDLGDSWERIAAELRKIEIVEVNRRPQSKDEIALKIWSTVVACSNAPTSPWGTRLSRIDAGGAYHHGFTRAAQTPVFDTMLQMARWCGYRPNYGDFVKIYTTAPISEYYQHITMVEEEIRRQVDILSPDADPMRVLVWIKEHKDMRVTAKMPADYIRSHWGEVKHPHFWSYETPYFGKNPGKSSEATFRALKSLVTLLGGG